METDFLSNLAIFLTNIGAQPAQPIIGGSAQYLGGARALQKRYTITPLVVAAVLAALMRRVQVRWRHSGEDGF